MVIKLEMFASHVCGAKGVALLTSRAKI